MILDEFYPGSKERRQVNTTPATAEEVPDLGAGRILVVQGRDVEFWGIGTLAMVLNRKPGTLRMWEKEGYIPTSGYAKAGREQDKRGRRRLWTREQIIGIWHIAKDEGILYPGPHVNVKTTQFKQRVVALFRELKEG